MFLIFVFSPVYNSCHTPICHRSTPLNSIFFTRLSPPKLSGHGSSVHLYVSPTLRPPPLVPLITSLAVLCLLTISLPYPGVPRRMPLNYVSLVRFTPLCRHSPDPRSLSDPRGSPFQGYLHSSACLHFPYICFPPYRTHWRPSTCRSRVVCFMLFVYPFPLCICLALPAVAPSIFF